MSQGPAYPLSRSSPARSPSLLPLLTAPALSSVAGIELWYISRTSFDKAVEDAKTRIDGDEDAKTRMVGDGRVGE